MIDSTTVCQQVQVNFSYNSGPLTNPIKTDCRYQTSESASVSNEIKDTLVDINCICKPQDNECFNKGAHSFD